MASTPYDRYPLSTVFISTALELAIGVLSALLLARLHMALAAAYLIAWGWSQARVYQHSCAHCAYYGRVCAFGRGVVCARLVPRGDPAAFAARQITWRDMLPDLALMALPILAGIVGLVIAFRAWALIALMALIAMHTVGNGLVRGKLACAHCEQRELGCPASRLIQGRDEAT